MSILTLLLRMTGGLCMFLFGMKMMSDGLQKSAGERMRKTLNFMTGNRFIGVLTGFAVTAIIQSSSAFTVIVISFVNAGLLTLTQFIGVLFGTNIGTTVTGWIISLVGFKISIDTLALPAIGIGFILSVIKWKYKHIGDLLVGFGFLFLGLYFLSNGIANSNEIFDFTKIGAIRDNRVTAILIGVGVGLVMTIIINSSSAAVTLIMTLAFQDVITYEMAAGMVLGSNVGTTINAVLAGIAGNTESKRAALAHVLFNVLGLIWALPFLIPLLNLVDFIFPGDPTAAGPGNTSIPVHLAGLHTLFNVINTIIFLPFVKQYAKLISIIIPDKKQEEKSEHYKFAYLSAGNAQSPELNILRAEKEISDMAGIVSFMYSRFCTVLRGLHEDGGNDKENTVELCAELIKKEEYIDEMREILSGFLIECSRVKLNPKTEARISYLMQVISMLESMSDECYSISRLLEKGIGKNYLLKDKEMDELIPYVGQVEEFLNLLKIQLGRNPSSEYKQRAIELENKIDRDRKKLQKIGRKRIEAGGNVKAELLFIDLVRRIEKLGDYCFEISEENTLKKIINTIINKK
ncbi:Na/Pi cotransporter family protein [Treponema sp. R80B11-R83G3]